MTRVVKVTQRDLEMLKEMYEHSFLSFYQIHEKHFAGKAKPTVYNRLCKLTQGKIIEALNVNLIAYHRNGENLGVIYRVTKDGLNLLKHYYELEVASPEVGPLNFSNLYHDLLLIDVIRRFKKSYPKYHLLSQKLQIKDLSFRERIPDAVILNPLNGKKIALELELNAKSEMRYRDIVLSYRTSNEFEKVLYVVKDESIQKKMGGVITGFGSNYRIEDDTDKFKFFQVKEMFNPTKEFYIGF